MDRRKIIFGRNPRRVFGLK